MQETYKISDELEEEQLEQLEEELIMLTSVFIEKGKSTFTG